MEERRLPLESGHFYHIFNRGNNRENLFYKAENYRYFLVKYDEYLSEYVDTYAYCLLPNHFHLLVRIKENLLPLQTGAKIHTEAEKIVSEAFRRFFTSYSKSINKQEGRIGSLFQKNFRRKEVGNAAYFRNMINYIHTNPVKHKIARDFRAYPHSSYKRMLFDKPSKLFKEQVLAWFGSKNAFEEFHDSDMDERDIKDLIIED
jgi:putative transposase